MSSSSAIPTIMPRGDDLSGALATGACPPAFVIIQRINLGLYAIFGQLGATANWRRISEELWPFADREPSTPLGIVEARWREANGR